MPTTHNVQLSINAKTLDDYFSDPNGEGTPVPCALSSAFTVISWNNKAASGEMIPAFQIGVHAGDVIYFEIRNSSTTGATMILTDLDDDGSALLDVVADTLNTSTIQANVLTEAGQSTVTLSAKITIPGIPAQIFLLTIDPVLKVDQDPGKGTDTTVKIQAQAV